MKYIVVMIIGLIFSTDPIKIRKVNQAKSDAKEAFIAGDYKGAAEKYKYLIDSLGVTDDAVKLNLAHALYLEKDTANAQPLYEGLAGSDDRAIRSKAHQQLGMLSHMRKKPEEAMEHFKQALKAEPLNEDARYNYEMLKKKLEEKKKQDEQNKKDDKKDDKKKEPSEFAKKLKAQADQLVAQRRYTEALNLMMDGLKKDETVSSYQDYMNRIKIIADINK